MNKMLHPPFTVDEVNAFDEAQFITAFGAVFEGSPWAAKLAWRFAPFESTEKLNEKFRAVVSAQDRETQLALLRAHPELGAKARLTRASANEQKGAGLIDNTEAHSEILANLNERYRVKFDFPFIVAVKGLTPDVIIEHMQRRLQNNRDTEFAECLRQVYRIAGFRLMELIKE